MKAYAVIETGGKQYRVESDDVLKVERLPQAAGEQLEMDSVLAISDGQQLKVGSPRVEGAKVTATIQEHIRGPKLVAFKKRRRKGSQRKRGHRQELTVLKIGSIG